MSRPARSALRGLGLLELLLAVVVLAIFLGSLALTSSSMLRMSVASDVRSKAQELGATTLLAILDDLRVSGRLAPFPYLFVDGAADAPFDAHDHAPAVEHASAGDPDFGPNREIVFLHPADDDRDGAPDFDADGGLVWGAREISYVLVTESDGVNALERRLDGRTERVLARHVERVLFDDYESSGFEVPLGSIRARLWFRVPDGAGGFLRHQVEATVGLRNGRSES